MDEEVGRHVEVTPPYFITSSENKVGREELLDYIESINTDLANDTAE